MSEVAPTALKYPILRLARDGSIGVSREPTALGRCSAYAFWANRYYDGLRVFDADACPFVVTSVTTARPYSGPARWFARLTGAILDVQLRLARAGEPSLAEAKRLVLEWIEQRPDFWEADGTELAEWRRRVDRARSVADLARHLE